MSHLRRPGSRHPLPITGASAALEWIDTHTVRGGCKMQSLKSAGAILFACSIAACGGEESRWAGTISDSAGVAIVSNPAVGLWAEADRWTVEEDLRIGAVEGDPEYQFGEIGIGGITTDSRGRIFVLDHQAQHIRVFSPEGEYEQTLGGRGGGPGELRNAWYVLAGPGDTLMVPDYGNQRVNLYSPGGSVAGSFGMPTEEGRRWTFRASRSGLVAEQIRPVWWAGGPEPDPMDVIVVRTTDGTAVDTLMEFPSGQMVSYETPGVSRLYYPEPAWDLTDDRQLLFGVNDEFRISVYSLDGQLKRIIAKQHDRRPVTDSDIQVIRDYFEARWIRAGVPAERYPRLHRRYHYSEFFPAFLALASGPAGTIWAQHALPPSEMSETEVFSLNFHEEWASRDWDVFDSVGRFLGVVTLPQLFTAKLFRGDKIYGIWRDELEVQYVVRLRIVGDLGIGAR